MSDEERDIIARYKAAMARMNEYSAEVARRCVLLDDAQHYHRSLCCQVADIHAEWTAILTREASK